MLNVALTGNIAAGKSTVVELFRRWGATVIDADVLTREAQAPGTEVLAAIAQRFGTDVLAADGSLDRAALRAKVMGDDAALSALNGIVHPAVRRRRDELQRAAAARGDALLVNDIPLLFEALDPAAFDRVVLVDAPLAVRRTRLRMLRGLSNEEADRMLAAQMPAERKRPRSHHVIENDGTIAELEPRARAVFDALRKDAAAAALAGVTGPIAIVADAPGDEAPALDALDTALGDAGITRYRATGRAEALARALAAQPPMLVVSSRTAHADAVAATRRLTPVPPVRFLVAAPSGPLDLRPWGFQRALLADNPLP